MIEIILSKNYNNIRADKFLIDYFNIPFSLASKILRQKKVKLIKDNSKQALSGSSKVFTNDKILVFYNINNTQYEDKPSHYDEQLLEIIKKSIIFEDKNILAINKPNGVACQGGVNIKTSISNILPLINKNFRLVHRLDSQTSGLLIIAKNRDIATKIGDLFQNRLVKKIYVAEVCGIIKKLSGLIHNKIEEKQDGYIKNMVESISGKEAITKYEVIEKFSQNTKVRLYPKTGRKHQLRSHMKYIGHPIVGDVRYGGSYHKRLMLHCERMEFKLDGVDYNIFVEPDL
jgi:23S rRNA pseudouridine955/2504/2580 synthase